MPVRRILFLVLFLSFESGFLLHSTVSRAELVAASDFKEVGTEDTSSEVKSSTDSKSEVTALPVPKMKPDEEVLTGTANVVRKMEGTEVFFKDLNESYFIPSGRHYNEMYKAFSTSSETGSKVTFRVNKKSRRVLSLEDAPPTSPAPASTGTGAPVNTVVEPSKGILAP